MTEDRQTKRKAGTIAELAVVLAFAYVPLFAFAGKIDRDEFAKSGTGAALATVAVGVYRTWKGGDS